MLKTLKAFLLPIALIVIGIQFTRDYFGATNSGRISQLEQLISNGRTTAGVLSQEYTAKTTKFAGTTSTSYEVNYLFTVNEVEYSGITILSNEPTQTLTEITYLPEDPNINALKPQRELENLTDLKGETLALILGLVLLLLGLYLLYRRYKALMSNSQKSKRKSKTIETPSPTQSQIHKELGIAKAQDKTKIQDEKFRNYAQKRQTKMARQQKSIEQSVSDKKAKLRAIKETKLKDFDASDHNNYMPK